MDRLSTRRALLAAVGGAAAGLAGCVGRLPEAVPGATVSPTGTPSAIARRGTRADICQRPLVALGIHAIVEPAFAPAGAEAVTLADGAPVIGLARDGRARAYPVSTLHGVEVVNEAFDGPLLVTYCPVCRSGLVARRVVDGEPTTFGVSGQVWEPPESMVRSREEDGDVFAVNGSDPDPGRVEVDGNLVLYDAATGSYWSQLLARAICGPRRGDTLDVVASTTATWRDWRRDHPDTRVLLPPPASTAGNPPPGGSLEPPGTDSRGGEPADRQRPSASSRS